MDKQVFDLIIVGAGTAGCLLANRLSANTNLKPSRLCFKSQTISSELICKNRPRVWNIK